MNSAHLDIPQFVIIHDYLNNSYKHPIIHYVFEQEEFPQVPKEKLIVVELDSTATQLTNVDSYNPDFQVTDCVLEQSRLNSQCEREDSNLFNLTIEGVSIPTIHEAIDDIDHLKEAASQFKERNEIMKKIFKDDANSMNNSSI